MTAIRSILEIVCIHGADPGKRMTGADEHHPIRQAEREGPDVGRAVPCWGNDSVEASSAKIAPQHCAVGLDHAEFDSRRRPAELQQQLRGERPPGFGGEPQPQAPDYPGLEIPPRGERHLGCGHRHTGTLKEQLAGLGQFDPTWMALEQLNAELGFEPPHLGRESWLGDPQAFGGAGEASLLGDRDEIAKMSEFHVALLRGHRRSQSGHFSRSERFGVQRCDVGGECPPASLRLGLKKALPPRRDEVGRLAPGFVRLGSLRAAST